MNALLVHALQLLGFFVLCAGGWYGLAAIGLYMDTLLDWLGF